MNRPAGIRQRTPLRYFVLALAILLGVGAVVGTTWWVLTGGGARSDASDTSNASSAAAQEILGPDGAPSTRADGLPAKTAMGANELRVRDFDTVRDYYERAIGLELVSEAKDDVTLGLGGEPLIRIIRSGKPLPKLSDAGLYHSAILFPDHATLAQTLSRLAKEAPDSYQGAADHRVSEAFYFGDPEGNGVELYVDRPREEWAWVDKKVQMATDPLDPNAFIAEHAEADAAGTAKMGHVHLKVGNLEQARDFYAETLGFDIVSEVDGALFYSAGGYHHHLATNTWQSAGAGPRSTVVGLGAVTIVVPDDAAVQAVQSRLTAAGHQVSARDRGITTSDPWGNRIHVIAA